MKKANYNPKRVSTLKELQYEKARVTIEMAYLEDSLQQHVHHYLEGGFIGAMGLGAGMFASLDKWKMYFQHITKGWQWIKEFMHKRKEAKQTTQAKG